MQDKYIGLVKKFYDDKGIEQISIVEVMHMVEFVEWLEQYAAQPLRAVDETICTCEKCFENPTKPGYCGVCGKPFHH